MDLSVPVAAVRQPADASVTAARARDQAAFDAAASTLAAGALDDAARETEFEAALRFASPACDDGSGDSEIGETDADGLSWPRILAESANGYDVAFDPRDWTRRPIPRSRRP
eukprot:tig00021623_g23003.t1